MITVTSMTTVSSLDQALAANLVAVNSRTADYADGSRCSVCRRTVQAGERVAELADGTGTVHVQLCATMAHASRRSRPRTTAATAAARAPRLELPRSEAQAAWLGRTEPSTQQSQGRRAHVGAQAG